MSERIFLFIVGVLILTALYFEMDFMIYLVSLLLFFEGLSNIRLTSISQKLLHKTVPAGLVAFQTHCRCEFDSLRVWRFTVAFMLGGSFLLLKEYDLEMVWFFPWFMGFAIMGAGVSSVCPSLLLMRWIGFK